MSPRPIEFPVEGISDGVVRLRLASDADVDAVTGFVKDPAVTRWTTIPATQTPAGTREWMQRGMAGIASGSDLPLVIADAESDRPLGTIGLHEIHRGAERAVAGYVIARDARRQGFGRRALTLLCRFAFDELRLARVEVTIEPDNLPSRALAQSVGFSEEGLLRSYMSVAGARRDMLMYGLLPDDLRARERSPGR